MRCIILSLLSCCILKRVIVHDDIICRFVIAKSRLAPLKGNNLTILKLEQQTAVLAVRLKEAIVTKTNVQPNSIYFWSNSRTVIKYIYNENSHFPPYGLVAKPLDSQSQGPMFKTTGWLQLQGRLSLSSFGGR